MAANSNVLVPTESAWVDRCRKYLPLCGAAHEGIRCTEVWMVKCIKEVRTEFDLLFFSDVKILGNRRIKLHLIIGMQLVDPGGAVSQRPRMIDIGGSVEPMSNGGIGDFSVPNSIGTIGLPVVQRLRR